MMTIESGGVRTRRATLVCLIVSFILMLFSCGCVALDGDNQNASSADTVSTFRENNIPSRNDDESSKVSLNVAETVGNKLRGAINNDNSKENDEDEETRKIQAIEMRSASFGASLLDAATMAVSLVLAVLVLPFVLVYRVSSSFRQAILAMTIKSPTSTRLKKKEVEDEQLFLNSSTSASSVPFRPQMLIVSALASNSSNKSFRSVLSPDDVQKILPHLPFHLSAKNWQLLFATELHGYSLHSAYRRVAALGPCVIAGMDLNRSIFAAFCSESLKPNGANYFGNGECWVASIAPHFQVFRWIPGSNEQFVLATESFLGFGGGGTFALWLDAQFDRGTSERNKTFGNATHLTSSESFKIASLEIWGFASPMTSASSIMMRSSIGSKAFKTVSSVMDKLVSKTSFGGAS